MFTVTKGMRGYNQKERRKVRMQNHVARDLNTPKYHQRIREVKKNHLIEELVQQELDEELYDFRKDMGLTSRE